jgi:hypothetical protein
VNKGLAIVEDTAGLAAPISPALGDPSNEQPSSVSASRRFDDTTKQKVTPRKPRKRLEEAFSGQTATPPQSSSKGSRRLAPKISTEAMQNDSHGGHYGTSGTPTQHPELLPFPATSADLFGYPMSAPATAPIFDSTGAFLDPDTSMSGMEFDFMTDDSGIFNTGSHRISSSLDWGRDNQLFQDTVNAPSNQSSKTPTKRQRPLAPKAPVSETAAPAPLAPFNFNKNDGEISASGDPFSSAGSGAVDPGLLYGGHNSASSPTARPTTSHVAQQPYEHQLRESRRDQEELRRSRSTRESSTGHRVDRGTMSSPIKVHGRPPLLRSVSDMRGRKGQGNCPLGEFFLQCANNTQDRILPRTGQSSPIRRQRPSSLTSIPESLVPRPRTEVIFTIDAKGKARTETIVVGGASKPTTALRLSRNEEREYSQYESSSDDEPIIVPSRNTSFTLPSQPKGPKLAHFETSNHNADARRQSSTANSYSQSESSSQRSLHLEEVESEAETVMEEDDGSGNATLELRKVMESRKQQLKERNSRHHRYASGVSPRGGVQYVNYGSSTNISPTTVTDPDAATPSSSGTSTTRCVCNSTDNEGFMIQW